MPAISYMPSRVISYMDHHIAPHLRHYHALGPVAIRHMGDTISHMAHMSTT